ncbi:MAG: fumarylacetoacetate hydrolase family protein [Burkholderiales bacterium]|nr:fumarylacetoacetate hydrolase family protein [Burkholderiales bacterium]
MNHRAALAALGDAASQPPYKAPPKAPVLYVKPRNTLVAPGEAIRIDDASGQLEVGAALGIVLGRTACNVGAGRALEHVAGYVIVADCSIPHDSFFRPAIRFKARDGSCAIGPRVVARADIADPDALGVRVLVDGRLVHEASTGGTFRGVAALIADISEFMTLSPGDLLLAGVAPGAPRVGAGSTLAVEIDGLGRLETRVAVSAEAGAGVR